MQSKSIDDTSRRMLDLQFDFGEVSIGTFIRGRDREFPCGIASLHQQPTIPERQPSRRRSGGDSGSLAAARRSIGAPQYWTASSLWQRQFLHDFYGLEAEDMAWVTFQPERMEGLDVPSGVRHRLETERTPGDLAEAGELDAVTTASGRRSDGSERPSALVPFFPDRAAAASLPRANRDLPASVRRRDARGARHT